MAFIAALVFKLLSRKVLFINRKTIEISNFYVKVDILLLQDPTERTVQLIDAITNATNIIRQWVIVSAD